MPGARGTLTSRNRGTRAIEALMISKRDGEPCIIQTFRLGGLTTPELRRAGPIWPNTSR